MKKRIFIAAHYLEIGGAETALIGLLGAIDYSKYDVDLFLEAARGEMLKYVPKEVNILPEIGCYSMLEVPLVDCFKKGFWRVGFARLISKLKLWLYVFKNHPKDHYTYFDILDIEAGRVWPNLYDLGVYDIAVCFIAMRTIVLDKVKAKKRICWIQTDYSMVDVSRKWALPLWNAFDYIASISNDVKKTYLKIFPETEDKIVDIENIVPKRMVEMRSMEKFDKYQDFPGLKEYEICLFTMGRTCEAKNHDNIPYMALELKKLGLAFHWYIAGPGNHEPIVELSKKLEVDEKITFLGPVENQYPYIKNCDLYVHPSRYEGKSIVVMEAQILCKPVIVTNYPTASSQINNGVDGIICDLDNKKIAEAIYKLAKDSDKQRELISWLSTHDYANEEEINKLYNLMD